MKTECTYQGNVRFVAQARRFVTETLGPVPRTFLFDLQLMTSELVNNAILHAGTEYTVAVTERDGLITVAVTDAGLGQPAVQPLNVEATSGRGLMIVAALAHAWGIDPKTPPPGKTVWFSVERPRQDDRTDQAAEPAKNPPADPVKRAGIGSGPDGWRPWASPRHQLRDAGRLQTFVGAIAQPK